MSAPDSYAPLAGVPLEIESYRLERLEKPVTRGFTRVTTVVRLRVDGDCQKYIEIPPAHRNAVVQRFKIMSKLDISEKRKPQDGKIRFRGPMGTIELRVATIPTSGGN